MTAILLQMSSWLPYRLRVYASEARVRLLVQFTMFAMVGLVGLAIDTATVYALRHPVGLYVAGILAYFVAASGTWLCNRLWTFRHLGRSYPWHVQWRRFLAANMGGFVINRGVYMLMVAFVPIASRE